MNLHPECQRRLNEFLVEALPHFEVQHGNLLRSTSFSELNRASDILPKYQKDQAAQWISDNPVGDFAHDTLSEKLRSLYSYQKEQPPRPLIELPEFQNVAAEASDLVESFISLPWHYSLFVRLPLNSTDFTAGAFGTKRLPLSDSLAMVQGKEISENLYPVIGGEEEPLSLTFFLNYRKGPARWRPESFYLQGDVYGFVPEFRSTTPVEDFEFAVRSFAGLGLAVEAFSLKRMPSMVPLELEVFVYRESDQGMELRRSHAIRAEYGESLGKLDWADTLKGLPTEKAKSFLERRQAYLMVAFNDSPELRRLRRAGQWYFDSLCGANELLSFVQATVALEIVLGEKAVSNIVGLGELMANRCAYLIGKTGRERTEVLQKFRSLYATRSQIVHSGKNRLTGRERADLWELRWMCKRVIQEELELVVGDRRAELAAKGQGP